MTIGKLKKNVLLQSIGLAIVIISGCLVGYFVQWGVKRGQKYNH